jgi:hypothetical protein
VCQVFLHTEVQQRQSQPLACPRCFSRDHTLAKCTTEPAVSRCAACGKPGHPQRSCPVPVADRPTTCFVCAGPHRTLGCSHLNPVRAPLDKERLQQLAKRFGSPSPLSSVSVDSASSASAVSSIPVPHPQHVSPAQPALVQHSETALVCSLQSDPPAAVAPVARDESKRLWEAIDRLEARVDQQQHAVIEVMQSAMQQMMVSLKQHIDSAVTQAVSQCSAALLPFQSTPALPLSVPFQRVPASSTSLSLGPVGSHASKRQRTLSEMVVNEPAAAASSVNPAVTVALPRQPPSTRVSPTPSSQ